MNPSNPAYAQHHVIVAQCESYLATHGDNHKGVGWPNYHDAQLRYQVMLEGIMAAAPADEPIRLLDFGCGPAHFRQFLQQHAGHIEYTGLDLSEKYLALARQKFPTTTFLQLDVLKEPEVLPVFDYIVLNGIFTQKCSNSFEEMWAYCQNMLRTLWPRATRGIAFNVMTKQVDWEREDLFHMPMDLLASFLKKEITRNFVFRHDYGLYEYTTYLFREPNQR
ncbi:methyltransferase domain-containing protein [Hymenobacter latericus]|uniref:methyltransferase domain-containing protein n=1 Tax=Hymenobacter sp. YIM 151858-1 TaxID=2987688 RepID=UPI002225C89A|nr:class I SAM-dependent methyltransferase [Hymenobacter sp. YIM 151858-1]UYZ57363.1 class I SAM-dependent methyltransferase [Hymenobacter sp. YIM 151858-1]